MKTPEVQPEAPMPVRPAPLTYQVAQNGSWIALVLTEQNHRAVFFFDRTHALALANMLRETAGSIAIATPEQAKQLGGS